MDVDKVKKYCLSLVDVDEVYNGEPNNILKYSVDGKQFAYFKTSEPEIWRFSFRVSQDRFLEFTDQPGIKPARYMHRFHWVTVVDISMFDDSYLKELVSWSYRKMVQSLSKVRQAELL